MGYTLRKQLDNVTWQIFQLESAGQKERGATKLEQYGVNQRSKYTKQQENLGDNSKSEQEIEGGGNPLCVEGLMMMKSQEDVI